jgi:hypothetical protein
MDLARNISLRRLHWVGHVMRMKDGRVLKKALKECVEGRPVGRPGRRWLQWQGCEEDVEMQDLEVVGRG